jgi:DNA ligase (NAD+)
MEIEGLGEKNIKLLYAHGRVKHFIDIYDLKKEDLMNLPRFAKKSAKNLIDAIERSKITTLARFIYSLGIIHVGEYASKLIAKNFKDINTLYNIEAEQIASIKHMGEKTAESVSKFFIESQNINVLKKLETVGLKISNPDFDAEITRERRLSGLTFVITGTLSMTRKDLEELIEKNGGRVSKSVSNKTSYLVLGGSPGSKLKKAKSLGINTLSYDDLLKLIQGE